MFPVFKMLMGLSFENLLKGIIVAQRGTSGSTGKLDKDVGVHRMIDLLTPPVRAAISISTEEETLLKDLEGYVTWAGRYPFPKREPEYFALQHSSRDHRLAESLWQRLYDHLKSNGWVVKMNGAKLPTG